MDQRKLYIPFTLASLVIVIFAFHSILSRAHDADSLPPVNSLEFENIIHHDLDIPLAPDHLSHLKTFFPILDAPEHSFALLFISGSDPCSNCFNEIADYLSLAVETPPFMDNHYSMLLFHGNDEPQSRRYVQASGMTGRVDGSAFIQTAGLGLVDYHNMIGQYGSHNLLYLIDLTNHRIFHGFVLPAGSTTAWHQKEIAFTNAISHQNN